jgi:tetratricopeptide (TPR) repeat protein
LLCGRAWIAAGRFDDALPLLERALQQLRTRYGGTHPAIADALLSLAGIYDQASRPDDARRFAEEALSILRTVHGSGDPRLLRAMAVVSGMRNRATDYDGALEMALAGATLAREALPIGDRRYNNALCVAAGFSAGFECGDRTRSLTDACVVGIRTSERGPVSELSSPVASTNAQGWLSAAQVYACLEDGAAEARALEGLRRYSDAENVAFELQTMLLAHLATVELAAGRHDEAEAKIRALLQRTRDTQVIGLREGMWRTTLVQALVGQGRHDEAREEAQRARILLEPGDEEAVGPERTWLREYLAR